MKDLFGNLVFGFNKDVEDREKLSYMEKLNDKVMCWQSPMGDISIF